MRLPSRWEITDLPAPPRPTTTTRSTYLTVIPASTGSATPVT
jgi:hypothetical protein